MKVSSLQPRRNLRRLQRGLSLIELMIALVLGLVVVAAAGGMFLANRRIYASTETINRVQENIRVAFELMSRDIREAGAIPCGGSAQRINMLNNSGNGWWAQFDAGLVGYENTTPAGAAGAGVTIPARAAGTDAVDLFLANDGDYVITRHDTPSAELSLNTTAGLSNNDIVLVCNAEYAFIMQITQVQPEALHVQHNGGNGSPGNCASELQLIHLNGASGCQDGASSKNGYCFTAATGTGSCQHGSTAPAQLARLNAVRWFVANNGRGSTSLYRARILGLGAGAVPTVQQVEEIAEGVTDLELQYRLNGAAGFADAGAGTNWANVNAVRVEMQVSGMRGALSDNDIRGTDGETLSRTFSHVVAIRNRGGVL